MIDAVRAVFRAASLLTKVPKSLRRRLARSAGASLPRAPALCAALALCYIARMKRRHAAALALVGWYLMVMLRHEMTE